jgi:predicted carbohydrate-binding protein with CBM5 and CBM33 domain
MMVMFGYPLSFSIWLALGITAHGQVTVYYQQGQTPLSAGGTSTATITGAAANYTAAAYNPTTLNAPPVPSPFNGQFTVQVQNGGAPVGVSIPQDGSFLGFSIEMSVVNQVCM